LTRPLTCLLAGSVALALPCLAAAQAAPSPSPQAAAPSPPPQAASPAPAASPSPGPLANTLKWSTASEVENFGYDVYRADTADGPWVRINAKPIAGAGTLDEPSYYQYADTDIDPTRTYFYYVESISLKGVREKFTPVIKAPPKRPAPGSPPASPEVLASPAPTAPASPAAPTTPAPSPSPSPKPRG
jgi:hypothetical protein